MKVDQDFSKALWKQHTKHCPRKMSKVYKMALNWLLKIRNASYIQQITPSLNWEQGTHSVPHCFKILAVQS